jgi:peptide/nickel transport system substrate-binding protein
MRIAFPIDPSTLNTIYEDSPYEYNLGCMIFSGLTTVGSHDDAVPDLAETVPSRANGGISADGLTIIYHLRPGLRWQDGRPLTASDVVFTFSVIRNPKSAAVPLGFYDNVASVVARDSRTVVVHMRRPQSDIVPNFFNNPGGGILPQHILRNVSDLRQAAFNAHPIGSGPYAVESWARGTDVRLRANRFYFHGSPKIEDLRVELIPDRSTEAFQLLTGHLDLAANIDPNGVALLRQAPSIRIVGHPEAILNYLVLRVDDATLRDPRVRRALALALDRSAIVRETYSGYAVPAMELEPPWSQYATLRATHPPNLKAAAALLDEAGWRVGPDGIRRRAGHPLDLTLTFTSDIMARRTIAVLLQSEWRRLGILVALKGVHSLVLYDPEHGALYRGEFQVVLMGWGPIPDSVPDRSGFITSQSFPPGGNNVARYRNGAVDVAAARASKSFDPAVRMKAYAVIASRIAADAPYIPLFWQDDIFALSPRVAGVDFRSRPGSQFCRPDLWRLR